MKRAIGVLAAIGLLAVWWYLRARPRTEGAPPAATAPTPASGRNDRLAHAPAPLPGLRLSDGRVEEGAAGGELAGRVVSTTTGAGVPGATLSFLHEGAVHTVTGDANGRFVFRTPAPGRYELSQAIADGYLPFEPEIGSSPIALESRAGVRIGDVTLYLVPAVEYEGLVLDAHQRPVAGAEVRRLDDPAAARLTSDAKGEFHFRAPDFAVLEASHPAHGRGRATLDLSAQTAQRLTLRLTGPNAPASAPIAGRVADARGAAVEGALIEASCPGEGMHAQPHAISGGDGRFELTGIDDCAHRVTAKRRGARPAMAENVRPGTRDVALQLQPGAILRGRVTAGGKPLAAFTVLATEKKSGLERGESVAASFFDAQGRFELDSLQPGTFIVSAVANGQAPSVEKTVEVPAPPAAAEVELALERGAKVSGVVIDRATRKPLAGARVSVEGGVDPESAVGPILSSATTDANGQFALGGVRAGARSLQAAAAGHNPRLLSGVAVPADGDVGPITIDLASTAPGEEPRMEFVGIGVVISAEGDAMVIRNVMPGGGGAEVGLQPGDAILAIEGTPATELGFAGSIEKIRGLEGTTVALLVRKKDGPTGPITVTRRALNR